MAALEEYRRKRDFRRTPEPFAQKKMPAKVLRFVIQRHQATHLHFDFRLEISGVLKSWALPKGPPLAAKEKRLAVATEDHPLDYIDFAGVIPPGLYGAGTVEIWDKGSFQPEGDPQIGLDQGKLSFVLKGQRLQGHFTLVKTGYRPNSWLLIAKKVEIKQEGV